MPTSTMEFRAKMTPHQSFIAKKVEILVRNGPKGGYDNKFWLNKEYFIEQSKRELGKKIAEILVLAGVEKVEFTHSNHGGLKALRAVHVAEYSIMATGGIRIPVSKPFKDERLVLNYICNQLQIPFSGGSGPDSAQVSWSESYEFFISIVTNFQCMKDYATHHPEVLDPEYKETYGY